MIAAKVFSGLEFVHGPTVGALGFTTVGHVKVHLGVTVPELHVGQRAGTIDAALMVEVFGYQFNNRFAHEDTFVSQCAYLGLRPLTMSKNALWIFSVIGPRDPLPSSMRSSSRIGVTSAAVPVKKASSLI